MGVGLCLVGIGIAGLTCHRIKKNKKEKKRIREEEMEIARRKNTPCLFSDGFTADEFEKTAIKAAKKIKRLYVSVEGPIIYGTVQSQSGISQWYFKMDFNDYGHITGNYWLTTDNTDSQIPDSFASYFRSELRNLL